MIIEGFVYSILLYILQREAEMPYIENHQGQDPLNDYNQQIGTCF